jgi:hypothetical protein
MDWYCILSLLSDKRDTIIHAGLYHTENITRKLVNDYGFNIISCMGVTELDKIDPLELSCVSLSE